MFIFYWYIFIYYLKRISKAICVFYIKTKKYYDKYCWNIVIVNDTNFNSSEADYEAICLLYLSI